MDFPSQAVIAVLTYLLPGFITASLVYGLTPTPRAVPFERVVQALIFTMFVQVGVFLVGFTLRLVGTWFSLGPWNDEVRLAWSVLLASALGLFLAWAAHTDTIHDALRRWGFTSETWLSSEWYGVFARNQGYVVLHLTGERRLYGWPEAWPSIPGQGHFVVTQAEWLRDDGQREELKGVGRIIVKAEDVEMVELMELTHTPVEKPNGRS
jgi:hypothetical protein